jgi:hypothetical protein
MTDVEHIPRKKTGVLVGPFPSLKSPNCPMACVRLAILMGRRK